MRISEEPYYINGVSKKINDGYFITNWRHAVTILRNDFSEEWEDIIHCLDNFTLKKSAIKKKGGRKSPIAEELDSFLYKLGWKEKEFNLDIKVDSKSYDVPTHKLDCVKNKIGLEIEWNNKDPFFDRDLNNFRILYDYGVIDVGVIITRKTELQDLFKELGKGSSYGASTTHYNKLKYRIEGNGAGGCPIVVFAISSNLYDEHS